MLDCYRCKRLRFESPDVLQRSMTWRFSKGPSRAIWGQQPSVIPERNPAGVVIGFLQEPFQLSFRVADQLDREDVAH